MNIEKIKQELKKMGYKIKSYDKKTIQAGRIGDPDTELGIDILQEVFTISIVESNINLEYVYYQLDKIKEFKDIDDLMSFIKEKFPV